MGNNSKRPLFLMSDYWEQYIICSLSFLRRGTDFVAPEFTDSYPPRTPPHPPGRAGGVSVVWVSVDCAKAYDSVGHATIRALLGFVAMPADMGSVVLDIMTGPVLFLGGKGVVGRALLEGEGMGAVPERLPEGPQGV